MSSFRVNLFQNSTVEVAHSESMQEIIAPERLPLTPKVRPQIAHSWSQFNKIPFKVCNKPKEFLYGNNVVSKPMLKVLTLA